MSSQQQNSVNSGRNVPSSAGPSTGFSLDTLSTAPLGPTYNPFAEWESNTSRRDNPITDFLFDCTAVDEPTQKESGQKTMTEKKPTSKKSTQKKPKTK
ncbi:hypothetical protein V493_05829 [Pseudogymnoascus sp. VKM F-4281 (FW-2241)]|nr:hypothetical protein V493_05829 [Pseudogymnoascus sp. VKM F-4281 (FW-2241)]